MEPSPAPQQGGHWLVHGRASHCNSKPLDCPWFRIGHMMQFWPKRYDENMRKRCALISQSVIWILCDRVIVEATAQIITVKEANRSKNLKMADKKDVTVEPLN